MTNDIDPNDLTEYQKKMFDAGYVPIPVRLQKYFDHYEWIKKEDLREFRRWFSNNNEDI